MAKLSAVTSTEYTIDHTKAAMWLVFQSPLEGSTKSEDARFVLAMPVVINAVLLATFAETLRRGQTPIIERFARLVEKELTGEKRAHCRRWTAHWCGFFALNGAIGPPTGELHIRNIQFYIPPRPQLDLSITIPHLTLSWPLSAADWTLETTTDLSLPRRRREIGATLREPMALLSILDRERTIAHADLGSDIE